MAFKVLDRLQIPGFYIFISKKRALSCPPMWVYLFGLLVGLFFDVGHVKHSGSVP